MWRTTSSPQDNVNRAATNHYFCCRLIHPLLSESIKMLGSYSVAKAVEIVSSCFIRYPIMFLNHFFVHNSMTFSFLS